MHTRVRLLPPSVSAHACVQCPCPSQAAPTCVLLKGTLSGQLSADREYPRSVRMKFQGREQLWVRWHHHEKGRRLLAPSSFGPWRCLDLSGSGRRRKRPEKRGDGVGAGGRRNRENGWFWHTFILHFTGNSPSLFLVLKVGQKINQSGSFWTIFSRKRCALPRRVVQALQQGALWKQKIQLL